MSQKTTSATDAPAPAANVFGGRRHVASSQMWRGVGRIAVLALAATSTGVAFAQKAAKDGSRSRGAAAASDPTSGDQLLLDFEGDVQTLDDGIGERADLRVNGRAAPRSRSAPGSGAGVSLPIPGLTYQGGDTTQRSARVVKDPLNPANQVLEFELRSPNVQEGKHKADKSRIQMDMSGSVGAVEMYESVRLMLGKDFQMLNRYPGILDWFTISEWWNNAGWGGEADPFRISVDLVKPQLGSAEGLNFAIRATAKPANKSNWAMKVWQQTNTSFRVPVNTWMRIEYYFKEGDRQTGRFVMAVTPDGGSRTVIADVRNYTFHPDSQVHDGIGHLNPIKLYTSKAVTEFVQEQNGVFRMYWDDLQIRGCGAPTGSAPSACATAMGLN